MDYLTRMLNCVLCESLTSGFANYSAKRLTSNIFRRNFSKISSSAEKSEAIISLRFEAFNLNFRQAQAQGVPRRTLAFLKNGPNQDVTKIKSSTRIFNFVKQYRILVRLSYLQKIKRNSYKNMYLWWLNLLLTFQNVTNTYKLSCKGVACDKTTKTNVLWYKTLFTFRL